MSGSKYFFMKPLFTTKKFFDMNVNPGDPHAFVSIADLDERKNVVEKYDVKAEIHELVNVAHGLEIFRQQGAEKFKRFARWINPRLRREGDLGFVHRTSSGTSTWGLRLMGGEDNSPYSLVFYISKGDQTKTFRLDPVMYLLMEKRINKAIAAVEHNAMVQAYKENLQYYGEKASRPSNSEPAAPPPQPQSPPPASPSRNGHEGGLRARARRVGAPGM